jgi:hypothetical protein
VLKNIFLYIIVLCSVNVYQFTFLGKYCKLFNLIGIGLIIALLLIHMIYDKPNIKKHFSVFIWIILLSLPFSMYTAYMWHNQSFALTAYEQRGMYYYFLYFLLPYLKPHPKDIQRLFIAFGIIFMAIYLFQYIIFPVKIMDEMMRIDRGTVRIYMKGIIFLIIGYFLCLQFFMSERRIKFLIFYLLAIIFLILNGSRQILLLVTFVTLLSILLSKQIKSKFLIYVIIISAAIVIFYFFRDIFIQFQLVTIKEKQLGAENVRFQASVYFLTELFPNTISYIFGNGAPNARSDYGHMIELLRALYSFNISDIGIIGNYVYYGILFVIGVILLLRKAISIKYIEKLQYLKFLFILFALSLLTGGGFMNSEFIVPLCMCLYLADISKSNVDFEKLG